MPIRLPLIANEIGERVTWRAADLAATTALFVTAAAVSYSRSGFWGGGVAHPLFDHTYFHADLHTVFTNLTSRASNHYRTSGHPLFSILCLPPTALLQAIGFSSVTAVRILLASVAGSSVVALYAVLRLFSLRALDAMVFAALLITSASFVFWTTVPETFAFGGLSILVVLGIFAVWRDSLPALVLANVIAVAFTITNWMVACYGTLITQPPRKAARVFAMAAVVTGILWALQRLLFSRSGLPGKIARYLEYVRLPVGMDLPVLFAGGVIAPEPWHSDIDGWLALSAERGAFELRDPLVAVGLVIWLALLGTGCHALARTQGRRGLRLILTMTLASQVILHGGFADGPFLYGMHYVPLLILVAAHGCLLHRLRPIVLALVLLLIPVAALHNLDVHTRASHDLELDIGAHERQ